ncbi:hypothetical protein I302_108795 [Kwoniella bestiolae CBS 10118]|uniref:DOMON domain-containing protein n=1 Tax=Kwoniella bestiolae CBS 10118 TaxID=1296100 RepID=A0AAJ8MCU3_9TREE
MIPTLPILTILLLSSLSLVLSFPSFSDPSTSERWSLPINPAEFNHHKFPQCSTNAECFRKGLPPLKPVSKTRRGELKPRQSAGVNVISGIIQVLQNGSPIGYVSGAVNTTYGGYGMTTNVANAMSVSFTPNGNIPVTFTLAASQRPSGFPYLASVYGGGTSAMNMLTTDYSYTFMTAANTVIPVGPAVASASNNRFNRATGTETSLFVYNTANQNIAARWINTDNTQTSAVIIYDVKFALFYLIGSFAQFQSRFPNEGEYVVTWRLIPQ